MIEISENRIVLEKVRKRLRVRKIIYGYEIDIRITDRGSIDIAPDPAKAVDANLYRHWGNVLLPIFPAVDPTFKQSQADSAPLPYANRGSKLAGSKETQGYAWELYLSSQHVLELFETALM